MHRHGNGQCEILKYTDLCSHVQSPTKYTYSGKRVKAFQLHSNLLISRYLRLQLLPSHLQPSPSLLESSSYTKCLKMIKWDMDQKLISHIALKNAALQGTKRRSKMQTPIIEKSGRGNRKKYLSKLVKDRANLCGTNYSTRNPTQCIWFSFT
jgi:hypothetical protein